MTDSVPRFAGDRYQRLLQGSAALAEDPAVVEGLFPFNSDGLPAFITSIIERQLLDDLTERDADSTSMMLLLDFHGGPHQMARRLHDWLSGCEGGYQRPDNIWAVASVFAGAMNVMIDALAGVDPFKNDESVVPLKPSRFGR